MTNFKRLQTMTIDELAEWLDKYAHYDNVPWTHWFDNQYCQKCESIEINYEDAKEKLDLELFSYELAAECAYCECNDHCRFFPSIKGIPDNKKVIKMWLAKEVENEIV